MINLRNFGDLGILIAATLIGEKENKNGSLSLWQLGNTENVILSKAMHDQDMDAPDSPSRVHVTGHANYLVTVAKGCRDEEQFTDVTLHCQEGKLLAHR